MYELENDDEIEIDLRELFFGIEEEDRLDFVDSNRLCRCIRIDHEVCDDTDLFFYSTALCCIQRWTFTAYRSYNGESVNTGLYGNC